MFNFSFPDVHTRPGIYQIVPDELVQKKSLTVGVWTYIAATAYYTKEPVTISNMELATLDGEATQAREHCIMRCIQRLVDDGWLVSLNQKAGHKQCLWPTWGRDKQGIYRHWDLKDKRRGRPEWMRGRRVPVDLLYVWIGKIIPQQGFSPVQRCFSHPLLSLDDVGVYARALKFPTPPTARLAHLGLMSHTQLVAPCSLPELPTLLQRAHTNMLSTLDRYGNLIPVQSFSGTNDQSITPTSGSASRSMSGSQTQIVFEPYGEHDMALECDAEGESGSNCVIGCRDPESESESINKSPVLVSSNTCRGGGGCCFTSTGLSTQTPQELSSVVCLNDHQLRDCELNHDIDPQVYRGHQSLNTSIEIPQGEWYELAALQRTHGSAQLLIWQSRAARRSDPGARVTPAYYDACAHNEEKSDQQHARRARRAARRAAHQQEHNSVPVAPVMPIEQHPTFETDPIDPKHIPTITLLQGINVRPDIVRELASTSLDVVEAAVRYACATLAIHSAPGWVVKALRDHRDHNWEIPEPHSALDERVDWAAERIKAENTGLTADENIDHQESHDQHVFAGTYEPPFAEASSLLTPDALCESLRERLLPAQRALLTRMSIQIGDDVHILCAKADLAQLHDLLPTITAALAPYGYYRSPRISVRQSVSSTSSNEALPKRPEWLPQEAWDGLPAFFRALLDGAQVTDGHIVARSLYIQRSMEHRFSAELSMLEACLREQV